MLLLSISLYHLSVLRMSQLYDQLLRMFPALLDLGSEGFYNRFEFAEHVIPKRDLVLEMGIIREAGL